MKRRQIIGAAAALAVTAYGIKAWSAEPIRIDLDAVLTGAGADIGERIRKVAQWAVEQINQNGGVQLPTAASGRWN